MQGPASERLRAHLQARQLKGDDFFAAATFPVGDNYLTLVNGGWGGSITGLSSIDGMDASQNETGRFIKFENQKWYRFRVRITAKTIRCWVDDKEVAMLNHEDRRLGTRLETGRASRSDLPPGILPVRYERSRSALTPAEIQRADKAVNP